MRYKKYQNWGDEYEYEDDDLPSVEKIIHRIPPRDDVGEYTSNQKKKGVNKHWKQRQQKLRKQNEYLTPPSNSTKR